MPTDTPPSTNSLAMALPSNSLLSSLPAAAPAANALSAALPPSNLLSALSVAAPAANAVSAALPPSNLLSALSVAAPAANTVSAALPPSNLLSALSFAAPAANAVSAALPPSNLLSALSVAAPAANAVSAALPPSNLLSALSLAAPTANTVSAALPPSNLLSALSLAAPTANTVSAALPPSNLLSALPSVARSTNALSAALPSNNLPGALSFAAPITDALSPLRALSEVCAQTARSTDFPLLPMPSLISALGVELAREIGPYRSIDASKQAWAVDLSARMGALHVPWLLPDRLSQSAFGFARLSRLSDGIFSSDPYAPELSELFTEELGWPSDVDTNGSPSEREASAVRAGLNPEIISFPAASYGQVLSAAGFEISPVPEAEEQADPSAHFHPNYGYIMAAMEQTLRQSIEACLKTLVGDDWVKKRIPEDLRSRWSARQNEDRVALRPVYSLIHYADFMDLVSIVCRKDNWRDVFAPIFVKQADFQVSMDRLHPVRKAVAHSRPLCKADVVTLVAEVAQIRKALKRLK